MEPTTDRRPGTGTRRLYRIPQRQLISGVAAGLAEHLGVPVAFVRVGLVVLLAFNGAGALLYVVLWAVVPVVPLKIPARRRSLVDLLPYAALAAGVLLLQSLVGLGGFSSALGWLIALIAAGAGLIWHLADADRRRRWSRTMPMAPWMGAVLDERDRRSYVLRLFGGGALVIVGIIGVIAVIVPASSAGFGAIASSALFAIVALCGVALALAPLLWRMLSQLRSEREGRIREAERAELAAMIHDQVLHTLALIQRNSGDPTTVIRLARGQERSLRNWLYKPTGSASETFAAAIEEAVAELEDTYAVAVESVVVGDTAMTQPVRALVNAAREALVNAARHAKVPTVSLYAEVEPEQVSVFVRDRGVGFDMSTVEADRHGVHGSIIGRMERHDGRAEIRTAPGEGTEVRLFMPNPDA
ncbi:MAG TPA: PspC domain-containing protein [Micromonosporaceae bacterium]|nr:PspC domain-containing protein [Micromonosporaceae bacterium]